MPLNTTLTIPASTWTQLTDADVTAITFQNVGGNHILIKATTDTTAPTNFLAAIRYNPGQGERNVSLADLFPGLSARDRIWAWADNTTQIFVSHL
jgi:hypothetical protein